jgi:hypothetical protein
MRVSFGRAAGFFLISLAASLTQAQVPSDAELDRLEAQVERAENIEAIKPTMLLSTSRVASTSVSNPYVDYSLARATSPKRPSAVRGPSPASSTITF